MKKLFKIFTVTFLAIMTAALVSISCFADTPKDNGSTAKEAMEQQMPVTAVKESNAMNELITYTAIGGTVTVAVIIAAVVIGVRSGEAKDENEQ